MNKHEIAHAALCACYAQGHTQQLASLQRYIDEAMGYRALLAGERKLRNDEYLADLCRRRAALSFELSMLRRGEMPVQVYEQHKAACAAAKKPKPLAKAYK